METIRLSNDTWDSLWAALPPSRRYFDAANESESGFDALKIGDALFFRETAWPESNKK